MLGVALVCAVIGLPWAGAALNQEWMLASPALHKQSDGVVLISSKDSNGNTYSVRLQGDCNLCATKSSDGGTPYWCWTFSQSDILKSCGGLYFKGDGNLQVVYQDGSEAWSTASAQRGRQQPWIFRVLPSGEFGIYSLVDSSPVWGRTYQGPGGSHG